MSHGKPTALAWMSDNKYQFIPAGRRPQWQYWSFFIFPAKAQLNYVIRAASSQRALDIFDPIR
jgi:hypothetical protein